MRVVIIGAGIGGLTLAQALRRAGVDVAVHDRDPAAEATGGYRLHLDERACTALGHHLAPEHYQALLASSASPERFRRFTVADHRMRTLAVERRDTTVEALLVGRVPLRRLLVHGLEDVVRFGSELTRFAVDGDGVVAHFADGGTDRGDLLVGADGARSRVATALAGAPVSSPLGIGGVSGRTPLTPGTRALLPDVLDDGLVLAFAPDGVATFLAVHDPRHSPVDPATCTAVPAIGEDPVLIWGVMAPDDAFGEGAAAMRGPALRSEALRLLGGWAEPARALVAAAEPASIAHFPLYAADPEADLTPWPAGRATALGDAVHAMPPTAGQAAVTAIRDADLLAGELAGADPATIPLAVHRYERAMAPYAAEAVRESLAPLRMQARVRRMLGPRAVGLALPVIAAAASLSGSPSGPARRRWRSRGHDRRGASGDARAA